MATVIIIGNICQYQFKDIWQRRPFQFQEARLWVPVDTVVIRPQIWLEITENLHSTIQKPVLLLTRTIDNVKHININIYFLFLFWMSQSFSKQQQQSNQDKIQIKLIHFFFLEWKRWWNCQKTPVSIIFRKHVQVRKGNWTRTEALANENPNLKPMFLHEANGWGKMAENGAGNTRQCTERRYRGHLNNRRQNNRRQTRVEISRNSLMTFRPPAFTSVSEWTGE